MIKKRAAAFVLAAAVCLSSVSFTAFSAGTDRRFAPNVIAEAELGSVKSDMIIAADKYSSGGRYIVSKASAVSKAENIKTDEASYLFDISKENTYTLYARVYFPASSTSEFYYRWNREDWKTHSGKKNSNYEWVKVCEVDLSAGIRKLEISHKSTGAVIDCFYLSSDADAVPPEPEGVEMRSIESGSVFSQQQKEEFNVTEVGGIFEAENAKLHNDTAIVTDKECSGGSGVRTTKEAETRDLPDQDADGYIEVEFTTDTTKSYTVWVRMLAPDGGRDSGFTQLGSDKYVNHNFTISDTYNWERIGTVSCTAGEKNTIRMRPRECGWTVDQFIVVASTAYIPSGIVKEINLDSSSAKLEFEWETPPYNPPANEHPRVYFRKSDIPQIKENMEAEENADAKAKLLDEAENEIEVGTKYSENILAKIMSKAFYYQLFGDAEKGRAAIDCFFKLADWDDLASVLDNTRRYGACIEVAGIVYDWCYDLTTAEERKSIINMAVGWATPMEIGWPPSKQGSLVTHGAEAQLLKDDMSFAIAVYDERPDIWNYVGGRFYEQYVPERQWHLGSQVNHQGNNYGQYRNMFSGYGYLLITGMGLPEPYSGHDVGTHAYNHTVYTRRPDGTPFLSGDMWSATPMSYNTIGQEQGLVELACSKDPLVKDELIRSARTATKSGVKYNIAVSAAKWLLFNQPQVTPEPQESMPLSYYFKSPMGIMYARTGWQEGVNSPVAVAEMKVGEYWFGNHQHKDSGSFQLYYKGPLATESGFYQNGVFYGSSDHTNYTMQSIAHNTMLVYDPNEEPLDFAGQVNDGGQRWPLGIMQSTYENIQKDPQHHRATVEAEEIDPQNPMTPEYTYIKGDLTNAYSDKISDFKRSFMFLNLDDDTVPAALIVFDKLSVPNPSLEKTWLLHGQDNPEISGSRTIWKSNPYTDKNTGETYSGKMVHDMLLPAANQADMKIASSPELGWNTIRGVNYPHPELSPDREENTYRLEISPKESKETNYFLNVMQVTDEGNTRYLSPELLETSELYGVKIKDRVVMFSKSGKALSGLTEIKSSNESLKYTICDIQPGTYKVTAGESEQTITAYENGGVLSFTAAAETVKIEKISDDTKVNEEVRSPGEAESMIIKVDGGMASFTETETVNDKVMVPAEELAAKVKCKRTKGFLKEIYNDSEQQIQVIVRPDSNILSVNGNNVEMTNNTYYKNGKLMVELRPFAEAFNYIVNWDSLTEGVYLVSDRKVIVKDEEGYVKITNAKNDDDSMVDAANGAINVKDRNLSTLWAAEGKNRYIDIELEREAILENIEIIFNPNSKRTPYFEIQISSDGVNYEKIYEGEGSSEADGQSWEVFMFDPAHVYKTKYVRYVANGSNMSLWNGVKEIRFKEGEDKLPWEMTDEYVKVIRAKGDDGEVDERYTAPNLIDSNSRTIWAAEGDGRYIDFELENETEISGLDIVFNPNSNRTAKFSVSVSSDGVNYEKIYDGKSNPNSEKYTWESFDFGKKVKAKYVRYTGHGSNISFWNGVNEIRIKK